MIEPEIAFADLKENMQIAEDMIKYVLRYVLEEAPAEMEFFDQFIFPGVKERAEKLVNSTFARVTYTEAIELLKKSGQNFEYAPEWGIDLQTERTSICNRLSTRNQSLLYETQRRWENC